MYKEERGEREEEYSSSWMGVMSYKTHDKIQVLLLRGQRPARSLLRPHVHSCLHIVTELLDLKRLGHFNQRSWNTLRSGLNTFSAFEVYLIYLTLTIFYCHSIIRSLLIFRSVGHTFFI